MVYVISGDYRHKLHLPSLSQTKDMILFSSTSVYSITQWNNCTALQLCDTGISSITESFTDNEEKVMWEDWLGAFGPNLYMIFSADLFSVLADQQLPVLPIERIRLQVYRKKTDIDNDTIKYSSIICVISPCVDESLAE